MKDDERPSAIRRSSARRTTAGPRGLLRPGELPGPFRRSFWRSPIRGPWLTSILGLILLAGLSVVFVTGLLSYAAYNPDLNRINDQTHGKGLLGFYLFSWPTHPFWLYRLNQGVHVTLGLVLIPVLLKDNIDTADFPTTARNARACEESASPQRADRPAAA